MYLSDLERPFWMLSDWLVANQNDLLKAGSAFSVLIPAYYFVYYRYYLLPRYKTLYIYLLVTSVTELVGVATMHAKSGNMWLYNPYALVELALFAILYRKFCYIPLICGFIKWSAIVCIALGIVIYLYSPLAYSVFIYTNTSILISIYLVLWGIETYLTRKSGINSLMFWFSVGAFLFFPTAQMAYTYGDTLARRPAGLEDIWNMVLALNISFHCFATGGILSLSSRQE